jgi:ABC-2 type transport system ATP-binding protein
VIATAAAPRLTVAADAITGPRLVVRGLTKAYGTHEALAGIDLELPAAALVAVLGQNGAGKSTLLGCVGGVLRGRGEILLDGRRPGSGGSRVAYLPQRLRLPGAATVDEILDLFRSLAGAAPDRTVMPAGFVPEGHRRIAQLSGGQAQRVALTGILMGAPDLLLLDEPLANLDDEARLLVRDLLGAHRSGGATVLVASPAALDLLSAADHVVRIEAGRIGFAGPARTFLARHETAVWVRLDQLHAAGSAPGVTPAHLPPGIAAGAGEMDGGAR